MKLVVGLGNPGLKYLMTRHNLGFMVVDTLAQGSNWKTENKAQTQKVTLEAQPVLLAKPQTFMNLSGESVAALASYYHIATDDILVLHDEVDVPFGQMRWQKNRSPGGHNGVKNIHQMLGTGDYVRLRLGVGRPLHPGQEVVDYVLQTFSKPETTRLSDFLALAANAVTFYLKNGLDKTASLYNAMKV